MASGGPDGSKAITSMATTKSQLFGRPFAHLCRELIAGSGLVQITRAGLLPAVFVFSVLAGCSSTPASLPPTANQADTATAGRLKGTMADWAHAVCGYVTNNPPGLMRSATKSRQCVPYGGRGTGAIAFGVYPPGSESAINLDLARLGPYAEGSTGAEHVIFAAFINENRLVLKPLEEFGFVIYPGKMSACWSGGKQVECPASTPGAATPTAAPTGPALTTQPQTERPQAPPASVNPQPIPPDADAQGFLYYTGARCNYNHPAVVIARTAQSAVVICQMGVGHFYYRGFGLQSGLSLEIDSVARQAAGFAARNNGVQYLVSSGALTITRGSDVLTTERMLEYWSK